MSFIFKSLIKVFVLLAALAATLEFADISFTLDGARQTLSKKLTSYTGRDVRIDGDIRLSLSYAPQLLVKRVHINNVDSFNDEDFITVSQIKIEVLLLPLLRGQVHLNNISADRAQIDFHKKADGSNNWSIPETTEQEKITDEQKAYSEKEKKGIDRLSLGKIELTNIAIQYRDETRKQILKKHLDELFIDVTDEKKPLAGISGSIQEHPYSIIFESEPTELFLSGEQWLLHGKGHIASRQTNIKANIQYKENLFISSIDLDVKNIDLGRLLEELEIISGQEAITENISIKARLRGKDLAELYEQAEIRLQLGKGYWDLQPTETPQDKKLIFTKISSFSTWKKPVELHIDGRIAGEPITIDFKSNRLLEFFDDVHKLDVDLISSVADTGIILKGTLDLPVKTRKFQLDISIRGDHLEKLNPIINTDFPSFNDFSLTGNLIANNKGYVLKSARASVGGSQLQASIIIETSVKKPQWHINLRSPQIQLEDFALDDLAITGITQSDTDTEKTPKRSKADRPFLQYLRQLEDVVKAPDMHLNLDLKVDRVHSGKDRLGNARFQLHLRENVINIENINIEIPGGIITSSISLESMGDEASGHVILDIDKLDYGITTRLFNKDSKIDGIISTSIDLQLGGDDFTHLLDEATGQLDIAVWPNNTKPAKALNLWTTNLYLILLPELKKKESLVNCLVGLMDMEDGTMREEFFAIDTTKLWINGNLNVNFKQKHVRLSLFPQSKTARLFALQSPIRAEGSFSDLSMEINPVDLTRSYISFITSPLHVPTRWIFGDKPLEDGSAICEQLFDREHVKKLKAEIEKQNEKDIEEMLKSD